MFNFIFEQYAVDYYGEEGLTTTMFVIDSKNIDTSIEMTEEFETVFLISKETDFGYWNSAHLIKAEAD